MTPFKRVALLAMFAAVGYLLAIGKPAPTLSETEETTIARQADSITAQDAEATSNSDARLQQAFENRESNLQIEGVGVVAKVLKDDTKGSPHQRFLLRTRTGQTLLVAHNIELAPRIVDIAEGDTVRFYGEYEWNEKGGVIHWTHHDPRGKHPDGWLEHRGQRYQ
ncbi:MAG TPA: DUF3465 domain-containing protein [Permianibacter sp.]|nr:DUF3465 domain-containing protein [Permianibacter sp.]